MCCKVTNRFLVAECLCPQLAVLSAWTELGKQWQQGQHKIAFQQKATPCSHQLSAQQCPQQLSAAPGLQLHWSDSGTRSPRTAPQDTPHPGAQCSHGSAVLQCLISTQQCPCAVVITSHVPGWAVLSPDTAAQFSIPQIYPKSASGEEPTASWAGAAEMWKPNPGFPHSQHNVYLPKLLQRRHQEPEPAPPPSPGCWEGFATQSIISSLSGFNGQLSTQLLLD